MTELDRRTFCSGHNLARLGLGLLDGMRASLASTNSAAPTSERPASPATARMPLHRPPGALDEPSLLARCRACAAEHETLPCAAACPHASILRAPIRFRETAGTPIIQALTVPCHDCHDRPCAAACPSGALDPARPSRMASVEIDRQACITSSSFCSSCVERCPVEGAISMQGGRPQIDATRCSGCGVCQHVCPAPQNAIRLLPICQGAP